MQEGSERGEKGKNKKERDAERKTDTDRVHHEKTCTETQRSCSCPNHSEDHLTIGRLCTCLQVQHPKICTIVRLFGPCSKPVALAVPVGAHVGSRSVSRGFHPPKSNCSESAQNKSPADELLVGEHHTRPIQKLPMPFATDREHAHTLQHVTAKVQPCAVNRGARTGLKHHAWRSSCNARHNVERDNSIGLCRRSIFGLLVKRTFVQIMENSSNMDHFGCN